MTHHWQRGTFGWTYLYSNRIEMQVFYYKIVGTFLWWLPLRSNRTCYRTDQYCFLMRHSAVNFVSNCSWAWSQRKEIWHSGGITLFGVACLSKVVAHRLSVWGCWRTARHFQGPKEGRLLGRCGWAGMREIRGRHGGTIDNANGHLQMHNEQYQWMNPYRASRHADPFFY